jgi:hypothetical protein
MHLVCTPLATPVSSGYGLVTPLNASPDLDAEAEDAPLRFRRVDDVLGPTPMPGLANRQLTGELLESISNEPSSVDDGLRQQ